MCNTSYDSQFQSIPFYQSHPYMVPFVGDEYESPKHKKLLLVGESHYMPEGSTVHHDVNSWYDGIPVLTTKEKKYCNTCGTREDKSGQLGKRIDHCLDLVLSSKLDLVRHSNENRWHQVAFFNYFLRPADKLQGIADFWENYGGESTDREKAIQNFIKVLEILKPDLFVFMSAKVCSCAEGEDFPKYFHDNLWNWTGAHGVIDYIKTNHPSRPPWNKTMSKYDKARGMTSRDFFCTWLKENWIR